jgi:hypothetical protein
VRSTHHFPAGAHGVIGRLSSDFKKTLQQWNTWDIITMIENHQLMKDYLMVLFQDHLQVCL